MPRKVVSLSNRKPGQRLPDEKQITAIEEFAEAQGNAVAGQSSIKVKSASPLPTTQLHQTTGLVERKGRILADGSRRGARALRRMTVYLPPGLAKQLSVFSAEHDCQYSEVVAEALGAWFDQQAQ